MKKFILAIFLILFGVFVTNAQTTLINISGHVTNLNGGFPIPNHDVHILADSNNTYGYSYYSVVTTDTYGYYEDSILIPLNAQLLFDVFTFDCVNNMHNIQLLSSNPPLIADFQICDSINTNCNANFYVYPDSITNFAYYFQDASSPIPPDTWAWDFGDGTTANIPNPYHVFNAPGPYVICLTITKGTPGTPNFCTDTYCENVIVDTLPGPCHNDFQYAVNNLTVDFFGMAFPPSSSYSWDFGDGNYDVGQNVTHTYVAPGMYPVTLVTIDSLNGCSFTSTKTVIVNGNPLCQAMFLYHPDSVYQLVYHFIDVSQPIPNAWAWDFGDGTTADIPNPDHVFNTPGVYNVCLTVYHINPVNYDTLCEDTHCEQITILPPISYNFAGQVFANFFPVPPNSCSIYLYRLMNNGDILPPLTTGIDVNGVYWFYQVPAGNYLLKVVPNINNPVFGQSLPTYFGDVLHWNNAGVIHLDHDFFDANVYLRPYQFFGGGPGSIGGKISFERGKLFNEKGTPAPNIEILLFDIQHIPIRIEYSDQNGDFKFNDLPFGTYQVYAEITGKNTTPVEATIDINNTMINDIYLVITDDAVIISLKDYVSENVESISDIYPNPLIDNAYIDLVLFKTSKVEFIILNYLGQIINYEEHVLNTGENRVALNTTELINGIYTLQIINDDQSVAMKKFIKIE